ncbi:MAG: aldo/keto reductase [Eubacteriaceae bacterium]|nr:aldo/keto reductase [Eubacteriaceae bacterium]
MKYRELGATGLRVSEIGFGGEWMERHSAEETAEVVRSCEAAGINILDCWMSDPSVRSKLGDAIKDSRERWIIQGHIGSTWKDGQYERTRDINKVKPAFEDLLNRFHTDHIELGMIHFVDDEQDFDEIINGPFYEYVLSLKKSGVIGHIGMSSHSPSVALKAAKSGKIEMLLFSVNPAYDLLPPTVDILSAGENINEFFTQNCEEGKSGIDPVRAELYRVCEQRGVGITVMKGFAGGRLFDAKMSPFGVSLTPIMCLHYALTRPGVASVMVGFDDVSQVMQAVGYENATAEEKDYASVIAGAPLRSYTGQCTYCGHCEPCPEEIDIAMVNKLADLAKMQGEVPQSIRAHYEALNKNASDCIACGNCEGRCPFKVPVTELMEETRILFAR